MTGAPASREGLRLRSSGPRERTAPLRQGGPSFRRGARGCVGAEARRAWPPRTGPPQPRGRPGCGAPGCRVSAGLQELRREAACWTPPGVCLQSARRPGAGPARAGGTRRPAAAGKRRGPSLSAAEFRVRSPRRRAPRALSPALPEGAAAASRRGPARGGSRSAPLAAGPERRAGGETARRERAETDREAGAVGRACGWSGLTAATSVRPRRTRGLFT